MTTLSPSKVHTTPGCRSATSDATQHSHQNTDQIPRSALLEPGHQGDTSHTSLTAVQALEAFNAHGVHVSTPALSERGSQHVIRCTSTSVSVDLVCNSESEADQDTCDSSIDIITERTNVVQGRGRTARPQTPLPARRTLSSTSPILAESSGDRADKKSQVPPPDPGTLRPVRSAIDIGKPSSAKATFLTKEALDAVNANLTSATVRFSPTRLHHSPTKKPWNSPTVSPKTGSLQRSTGSPTKPSHSPRTALAGTHTATEYRRAPSSVASTGATTFHTAYGSPVRSIACSQSSYSSAEDFHDHTQSNCISDLTNMDCKQIDELHGSKSKTNTTGSPLKIRARPSKPELSINIPSRDSPSSASQTPVSALSSATSSLGGASPRSKRLNVSSASVATMQSSRIPRVSSSKGSTAHAPTLSSTLKQSKSAQNLRSPKASTSAVKSVHTPDDKAESSKPTRHVRTLDSTGSTPIMCGRGNRNSIKRASIANFMLTEAEKGSRTSEGSLDARTPSRATSTSTIKAIRTGHESPAGGIIHSSDADDEYDDSTTSAPSSANDLQDCLHQNTHSLRRTTLSDLPARTTSTSDLRATAEEFVPAMERSSNVLDDAPSEPPLVLPDLSALDGYGIPWYYHMYPVPYLFPPVYTKGRGRSPKKLRPRKQRSTPGDFVQEQGHAVSSLDHVNATGAAGAASAQSENAIGDHHAHEPHNARTVIGIASKSSDTNSLGPAVGSFVSQFDEVAQQTARQTGTREARLPRDDLTSIRNVGAHGVGNVQGYHTMPSRRRTQHVGNGLYGGRGNVGVPLHATAPFPNPVPPMGRPADGYVGYHVGARACGIIDIEKAFEHGGRQACNSCEPDH